MSLRYFKSLLFRAAQIQEEINRENIRPRPDWLRLLKLKKLRFAIKDRLERLTQPPPRPTTLQPVRIRPQSFWKKHRRKEGFT